MITMISPCYYSSVLKKYIKCERMCGYNYSFIIEKDHSTNGWLQLEANQLNIFENRDDFKISKKGSTLKIVDHCQVGS